jgi:hypothetical protein
VANKYIPAVDISFCTSLKTTPEYKYRISIVREAMSKYMYSNALTLDDDEQMLEDISLNAYKLLKIVKKKNKELKQHKDPHYCEKCKATWLYGNRCPHEIKNTLCWCNDEQCKNVEHIAGKRIFDLVRKEGML